MIPVTLADREFLKSLLERESIRRFPNHQVIGEEFGKKKSKSDYTWVIRPNRWDEVFYYRKPNLE